VIWLSLYKHIFLLLLLLLLFVLVVVVVVVVVVVTVVVVLVVAAAAAAVVVLVAAITIRPTTVWLPNLCANHGSCSSGLTWKFSSQLVLDLIPAVATDHENINSRT
jgi:hypothetical protein